MADPITLALLGGSFGAQLFGGLLRTRSERNRLEELRKQYQEAIQPLEADALTRRFGTSQSAGSLTRRVTRNTLTDLSSRGVLDSNIAAPAVAEAVAPIEAQETARRLASEERLAAAKFAIAEGTSLPGYGNAFGGFLEDLGSFGALQAGMHAGAGSRNEALRNFRDDTLANVGSSLEKVQGRRFNFGPQYVGGR